MENSQVDSEPGAPQLPSLRAARRDVAQHFGATSAVACVQTRGASLRGPARADQCQARSNRCVDSARWWAGCVAGDAGATRFDGGGFALEGGVVARLWQPEPS